VRVYIPATLTVADARPPRIDTRPRGTGVRSFAVTPTRGSRTRGGETTSIAEVALREAALASLAAAAEGDSEGLTDTGGRFLVAEVDGATLRPDSTKRGAFDGPVGIADVIAAYLDNAAASLRLQAIEVIDSPSGGRGRRVHRGDAQEDHGLGVCQPKSCRSTRLI